MWGMNVNVPFGDAELGFEIVIAIMIGVLVVTLVAFRRLRLL
jgi:Mg2+ and Co2+ transporter CorA